MTNTLDNPFLNHPPAEVPLPRAPLVRVLSQLRYPTIAIIEDLKAIAPFQEALRDTYPVLREEMNQNLVVSPSGSSVERQRLWRFSAIEGEWRVSLAAGFVALETSAYTNRHEFLARLSDVIDALASTFRPKAFDRFGLRYVDRISGSSLDEIERLVRPEVRGIVGSAVGMNVRHGLSETVFEAHEEQANLLARWGLLPPNAGIDPSIPPVGEKSWILDLDMFVERPASTFDADELKRKAEAFATRSYTFFRWAVTDDFLREYGATI